MPNRHEWLYISDRFAQRIARSYHQGVGELPKGRMEPVIAHMPMVAEDAKVLALFDVGASAVIPIGQDRSRLAINLSNPRFARRRGDQCGEHAGQEGFLVEAAVQPVLKLR